MWRRALSLGLALLAVACGPKPLAAPPAAPRLARAAELIPPDLDVVVRLDLGRMKAALGALTPQLLSREVLSRASGVNGSEPDELMIASLLEADVAYLGYRPNQQLLPLDRVLALEGDFAPLTKAPSGFSAATDLGGDVRYWDKTNVRNLPRESAARLYTLGNRVRGFVSEAELDAVERTLSGLDMAAALSAPEEGALSLAARPRVLGGLVSGSLRELLQAAKTLQLVVDLEADAASLQVALVTASPEHAEELVRAGSLVLSRAGGERAKRAQLRAEAERLLLTLRLSRAELGPWVSCLRGASASADECAW